MFKLERSLLAIYQNNELGADATVPRQGSGLKVLSSAHNVGSKKGQAWLRCVAESLSSIG